MLDPQFILEKIPLGVLVYDQKMNITFSNKQAKLFLNRFEIPIEIPTIAKRIFESIKNSTLAETIPGEIYVSKRFNESQNNWIFKFDISIAEPAVCVFIIEEKTSNKIGMNELRQKFRLTRRETDVLRRVLDGLKNTDIAEELDLAEQTVKDHLTKIYMKIGVENRFALIRSLINS